MNGCGLAEIQPSDAAADVLPAVIREQLEIVGVFRAVFVIETINDVFGCTLFKNIKARWDHFVQLPAVFMLLVQPDFLDVYKRQMPISMKKVPV